MGVSTIIATAIPTAGVCLTAWGAWLTTRQDREFRLDVSSHERVQNLMRLAEGHAPERKNVTPGERIGALLLLESLAMSEKRIQPAVTAFVDHIGYVSADDRPKAVTDCAKEIWDRLADVA